MIPSLNSSGVLPPFVGASATSMVGSSPYKVTMLDVVGKFASTPARRKLLRGLIDLRTHLKNIGIVTGVQWIDGSFCTDIETLESRAPNDIDLLTVLFRPPLLQNNSIWSAVVKANPHIFNAPQCKATFGCDAYYVDGGFPGISMLGQISYWYGLFSHQRKTHLWKGMLQLDLASDDSSALASLQSLGSP